MCEVKDKSKKCPFLAGKGNPKFNCPFVETITENKTNINWLKKFVTLEVGLSVASFISLLGLIWKVVCG